MKAAQKFMSAASAVALSAGLVVSGASVAQLVFVPAAQAAVVNNIEVRGNQRVEAATIREYVGIEPGEQFSNADIDEGVKRAFATGLFSDVRINQAGSTLVIEVDEYSIVNQVLFQGNKKIKDAELARAVQLQPRGAFSNATLEADAEGIRQAYSRLGRDDATVTTEVVDLGENRVNVVFNIVEGGRTKIATINFVGNNAYSDRRLQEVISTKRSNILSFLFRDDVYDEQRLRADEEALRRFYYNRGYADFQVISSSAELDETENEYTVSITVEEGDRYTFGDISIESTVEGIDATTLDGLLETRSGKVYSAEDVEDTIIALTERVSGLGYAFAQVTPRGDRDFENRTISVVYTIDQGPRTYVERIEIRGNTRTRDYVIRREFDVSEGDAFNQVLIQRAKRRLERLDFFTAVNISTAPGSQPDQVILVVDLVEKATGEFSIGGGYSTGASPSGSGGVSVEASVTERNFLGRGQFIKVAAGGGLKGSRDYSLSFTEPYFLGRRIAAGFDIYRQNREYDNYDSELTGATVRFGLPITDALSTQLAYNYSVESYDFTDDCDAGNGVLDPGEDADGDGVLDPGEDTNPDGIPDPGCTVSPAIADAVAQGDWVKSSVSAGLTYNTIDDLKNPRDGIHATFSTEYAGLGGDAEFIKITARGNYYRTLLEEQDVVGLITIGGGHVMETGSDGLRVFDHFRNTDRIIRGFEYGGIGPYQLDLAGNPEHLGGTTYFHATAEAQFPLPLFPQSFGLRGAVFADAATLYGSEVMGTAGNPVRGTGMEWRASVGASVIWASPFGPLRLDYAVPVVKESTDEVQNFNFGISTRF